MPISGEEVLAIRSRMGKTQGEMASLCGVSVRTWRRWEDKGATELVSRFILSLIGGGQ